MTSTPRGPGLWEQATSSRGGRLAVALAIALACLLALTAAVALAATARGQLTSAETVQPAGDDSGKTGATKSANGKGSSGAGAEAAARGNLESIPGLLGGTLHGEVTRPLDAGGTEALLVQTGSVTASSATQVTVTSTDGFAETYAVGANTQVRGPAKQGGLAVGTRVTVVASKDGKRALLVASKGGTA